MKHLFLLLAFIPSIVFCQHFKISEIPATYYTIDKISQVLYFQDLYTDTVRDVNLKDMSIKISNFPSLPVFKNLSHQAIYCENKNLYLYDFKSDSNYILIKGIDNIGNNLPNKILALSHPLYVISPNDNYFLFDTHNETLYYSFLDSSVHHLGFEIYGAVDWNSDTSFIFQNNNDALLEYSIKKSSIDTIIYATGNITGYAYNIKNNILAYGLHKLSPQIIFHYFDNNVDSIAFDFFRDYPNSYCRDPIAPFFLKWSPDFNNLVFFLTHATVSASGIYLYNLDSSKIYQITDCMDGGLKYFLNWANTDTIIFANTTDQLLYGFNAASVITSITSKRSIIPSNEIIISCYPNPFNLNTFFRIKTSLKGSFKINIYDALGRLVKIIDAGSGLNNISWDGTNNYKQTVSSGLYFAIAENSNHLKSNTLKILLIK